MYLYSMHRDVITSLWNLYVFFFFQYNFLFSFCLYTNIKKLDFYYWGVHKWELIFVINMLQIWLKITLFCKFEYFMCSAL